MTCSSTASVATGIQSHALGQSLQEAPWLSPSSLRNACKNTPSEALLVMKVFFFPLPDFSFPRFSNFLFLQWVEYYNKLFSK